MGDVVLVLRTMGSEQLFLALVFLASYSLALGEFATARGRVIAAATAAASSRPRNTAPILNSPAAE